MKEQIITVTQSRFVNTHSREGKKCNQCEKCCCISMRFQQKKIFFIRAAAAAAAATAGDGGSVQPPKRLKVCLLNM